MSAEEEIDPEVLAAIEASKNEAQDEDEMIRAALEESIREAEQNEDDQKEEKIESETKSLDEKGAEDSTNKATSNGIEEPTEVREAGEAEENTEIHSVEKKVPNDENNESENNEECDKEDPKDDTEKESKSEEQGSKSNGHSTQKDSENNESDTQSCEIKLQGEPVIEEDPDKMKKIKQEHHEEENGGDPLNDGDDDDEDDEDEIGVKKRKAKSKKRKRSSSSSDEELGSKRALRARGKSSKEILYRCPLCTFTCEVLGELIIHKFKNHSQQMKPTYLDIAEVVVAQMNINTGGTKDVIFQNMEKDYSEYLDGDKKQSMQMLSRALEGGVQIGRLRKGGKGNICYLMVGKEKRKMVFDKWTVNKRSVEYKDVKSVKEGSKEYLEIQAQLRKLNMMMGGGGSRKREESDDEICVVEEKITDKARKRAEHRKRLIAQKRRQIAQQRALAAQKAAGPKTVIKVNSVQGKQLLRKIVATGSVPGSAVKQSPQKSSFKRLDDDEEEAGLTCPVCMSSFWYPNQTLEHLKTAHNYDNPEKHLKDKQKIKKK